MNDSIMSVMEKDEIKALGRELKWLNFQIEFAEKDLLCFNNKVASDDEMAQERAKRPAIGHANLDGDDEDSLEREQSDMEDDSANQLKKSGSTIKMRGGDLNKVHAEEKLISKGLSLGLGCSGT